MSQSITPKSLKVRLAIGRRLRRAREKENLSLRDAARRAGIPKIRWLRFEQGKRPIPAEFIVELARAANTNVVKLLSKAA